ncbi:MULTISPECIES: hypothetical protein [Sphingobium]|uniref:hypothetical protein n=1 Tax=Sphingobium TaxID=165695 RepID=UPI0015ECD2FA|nr:MULTISPECIES: hypothetical protein [Sphingobium]MCW2362763.1 hypothetical protein [Sphingobium sp. B10D3B]MCW2400556.1 hypothetical protein [Sphingobium sp. B10D7B]MCW2407535.1 hypothetical protein [Sphingobium xanthum]
MSHAPSAQAGVASPVQRAGSENSEQICVSILVIEETLTVGRGPDQLKITMGRGACEPKEPGVSSLHVSSAIAEEGSDAVIGEFCPVFLTKIEQLWAGRAQHQNGGMNKHVQTGPFRISGQSDLFSLHSSAGRREAIRWLKETLNAVRPCWNNFRDDRSLGAAVRLYDKLGLAPLRLTK